MQEETYPLSFQKGETNEFTARIGNYTGVGTTREAALTQLSQRINGLPNAERNTLWSGGQQKTKTAG